MKPNKLTVIVSAGMLLLSMLACNIGKRSPDVSAATPVQQADVPPVAEAPTEGAARAGANACVNPYLPVVQGATWNYKLTGPVPDTFMRSILSVEESGFTDQDVFGKGITRQGKWSCDGGALTALDPTGGDSSASVNGSNVTVDFQTTSASGVTLPASLNPGDSWTQAATLEGTETINGEQIPAKNEFSNPCTVVGPESVTVEAGTFDAVRIDCVTTMNITITLNGTASQYPTVFNASSWYAENIGLIKTTSTGSGIDSVIELVSYSIP